MLRLPYRQSNPPRSEGAPEVAVREDGDISLQRAELGNQSIGPVGDAGRRFTVRTPISKEIPVRPVLSNVHRALSLIIAVVPLH